MTSPSSDDNGLWVKVTDGLGTEEAPYWYNSQNADAISYDGGVHYYDMRDPLGADGAPVTYETALRPVPDRMYPKDLSQAVFQALGTASVAWESMAGTGVFDDKMAREAGEDLIEWVNKHYDKKENPSG